MNRGAEVTAGDIARLADVSRAAVSNWRKRYPDFPKPVGGSMSSPTFPLDEVEQWLEANGRMPTRTAVDRLHLVLQRASMDTDDAIAAIVRRLSDAEARTGPTAQAVAEILAIADEIGLGAVQEALATRFVDLRDRRGAGGRSTSTEVAALVAELAQPQGATVMDPACRTGVLLHAALTRRAARVVAQDADDDLVAIARARLASVDGVARVEVRRGDLIDDAFGDTRVDIVVSDPPNGGGWPYEELAGDLRWEYSLPPRSEPELAWIQHALARLHPGGHVWMLLPPGVAERPAGRRVRRELLRRGALRAVIALPTGVTAPYNMRRHLWMLRRPEVVDGPQAVLMVDAEQPWPEAAEIIRSAMRAHRADSPPPDTVGAHAVRLDPVSLISEDVDLTPSRHVSGAHPAHDFTQVSATRTRLAAMMSALPETLPPVHTRRSSRDPVADTTVGDLIKRGTLVVLAEPGAALHVGDVLISSTGPRPELLVVDDTDDGRTLDGRHICLRSNPDHWDPWFLVGCLGSAANLRRVVSTGSIPRIEVRRARIPSLSRPEQHLYGEYFRRLREMLAGLQQATALGEEFVEMTVGGLLAGTLDTDG
ncbi:N-6 DNA methylase [Actinoplanes sichuanensis]|uniref:N-6 DNA methylase n=1 Tax=Actinoplanes sichuanensis TaxID=512349 RepID=A0ABW4AR63_9ACTN|nr:N-6 DNA methylase [Actinoplanes sichuanensis]BEL01965.1 N-6 DNA methylase [Actinoplanes sichuanensis]